MKTQTILLLSHAIVAATGAVCGAVVFRDSAMTVSYLTATTVVACVVFLVVRVLAAGLIRNLRHIVDSVTHGEGMMTRQVGVAEIETAAIEICDAAQRWSQAAATGRNNTREIEELVGLLDQRQSDDEHRVATGRGKVRRLLGGLASKVDDDLRQLLTCVEELSQCMHDVGNGAEDQSDSVAKTSTYIEHISAALDTVRADTESINAAVSTLDQQADAIVESHLEVLDGIDRVDTFVTTSHGRLQLLGDHTREIAAMIESIADVAARTDLLALNASIESVRVAEHGRGFSVVAEEVHRLAEQTTHTTRELAALIETAQTQASDMIAMASNQHSDLDRERNRVRRAEKTVRQFKSIGGESAESLRRITQAVDRQCSLIEKVGNTVANLTGSAKSTRGGADKGTWTSQTLSRLTQGFDQALEPLRACRDGQ